jgi:SAM-dependent methyltransferase
LQSGELNFVFSDRSVHATERVKALLVGCSHYQRSDLPLFIAAYNELCRINLDGAKILEICCGAGNLAAAMARAFPKAEVIALDRYPDAGSVVKEAAAREKLSNVYYRCGDATRLVGFSDASLDLIYGQATLHHLAHDEEALRNECSRVLKPGGRLIFIYEPLGHNPVWAMIRAWRTARREMPDESNVFISQLQDIAKAFTSCEVQPFNLFGYPLKCLGRLACFPIVDWFHRMDVVVMKRSAGLAKMAANFNVVFTK